MRAAAAAESGDISERDYWRDEKKQLHEKEKQLHDEKKLYIEKQLHDEKKLYIEKQLREEALVKEQTGNCSKGRVIFQNT